MKELDGANSSSQLCSQLASSAASQVTSKKLIFLQSSCTYRFFPFKNSIWDFFLIRCQEAYETGSSGLLIFARFTVTQVSAPRHSCPSSSCRRASCATCTRRTRRWRAALWLRLPVTTLTAGLKLKRTSSPAPCCRRSNRLLLKPSVGGCGKL